MDKRNEFDIELLENILDKFNIRIQKLSNYLEALTHASYSHEHHLKYNYERFEFLGDASISWIISNFLFSQSNLNEGEMSIKKSKLVSGVIFTNAAKELKLDKLLLIGNGLKKHISDKVLENAFESFIGAVVKDSGIKKAYAIINKLIIEPYLNGKINVNKPYKTLIQEALLRTENNEIKYVQLNSKNCLPRKVKLVYENIVYGFGEGRTLKDAEENAAKNAYDKLMKY